MLRMKPLTIALAATTVGLAACIESTNPEMLTLGSAFSTATAGFNEVSSSFAGGLSDAGLPWQPEHGRGGRGGRGMGGPQVAVPAWAPSWVAASTRTSSAASDRDADLITARSPPAT